MGFGEGGGAFLQKGPSPIHSFNLFKLPASASALRGPMPGDRGKLGGRGGNDGIKGLEMIPEQPGRGLAYAGDAEQFGGKRRARPRPAGAAR